MYIIATFEYSNYLELAITTIQMKGIVKEKILCVPIDKRSEDRQLFDTIHSADGLSLLDLPIILATLFCLFGGIYGFVLKWGPIMWGLINMCIGFSLGLAIKLLTTKKYNHRQKNLKSTEVVIIIDCTENQSDMVKNTLWEHKALGVSKLSLN